MAARPSGFTPLSMIQGVVFDFDGLILDTEEPIFRSWQEIYRNFGCELSFEDWANTIGSADFQWYPMDALEQQVGHRLEQREGILQRQHQRELELILKQPVLPGVKQYLQDARRMGLKIGLASSSTCAWVVGHLERLGLRGYFDVIRASDDVEHTKPDPELFLSALEGLVVKPEHAVAFEDSPNGILAAKRAGMWCVAVPNTLTRRLPLDYADLRLETLETRPLISVLEEFIARRNQEV